uniref:Reticulocyte-binding protein 2 a n=1 Tax=Bactrocera latifrons TaxID=174628 RepID=A0A0K8VQD8_BACLA
MRLFVVSVLSLLAASSGAYAAAVAGYPYRAELLAYSPARGEFAAVNALTPDYAHYINQQAAAQIFGYRYPEQIESRRITYEEYLNQLAKGTLKDETELIKKRDEHFRLWAVHVYDQYRQELERLKAAGKEPTADMLAKINAFEVVLTAPKSDYSQETSIIKQLREEHLRFWNESRSKAMLALQQEEQGKVQQTGAAMSTIYLPDAGEKLIQNVPTQAVFLSETAEQKKAREEHLRIYQEQVQRVQALQASAEKLSDSNDVQSSKVARLEHTAEEGVHQPAQGVTIVEHLSYLQETPEVQRAKAEHLRLWNEAKLRAEKEEKEEKEEKAEKEGKKYEDKQLQSQSGVEKLAQQTSETQNLIQSDNTYFEQQKQLSDAFKSVPLSGVVPTNEQKQEQTLTPVQDTPEVKRAREEHLREFEETLNKVFVAPLNSENAPKLAAQQPAFTHTLQQSAPAANNEKLATAKSSLQTDTYQSQPQVHAGVQETAEVQRAREEHLKLVKEAHLKASQISKTETVQTETEVKPLLYDGSTDKLAEEQFADEEARLRVEEAKQREVELLAETERLREEQRLQAEELLRLQQEEQRRQEQERLDQSNENKEAVHYAEKPQLPIAAPPKETLESLIQVQHQSDPAATYDIRDTEKYAANPYLLRYAVPSGNVKQIGTPIATTAYYIGAQKPAQPQHGYANPGVYYLRDATEGYLKLDNPYFLHYINNQQGGKDTLATADAASLASALAALHQAQKIEQPIAATFGQKPSGALSVPIAPSVPLTPLAPAAPTLPIAPLVPNADNMRIVYGDDAALAALEKATREHFRAHEIALEQLRLANQKQSPLQKDCY